MASLVKTLCSWLFTIFVVLVFNVQPAFSFSTNSIVANQMFSTGYCKPLHTLQFANNFLPTRHFPMHSAKTKFSPQLWFYHRLRDFLQLNPIKCFDQFSDLPNKLYGTFQNLQCKIVPSRCYLLVERRTIVATWLSSYFFKE